MDISKVLDEAKRVMQIQSDYELAKRLEINKANLTHYRKGERIPDAYTCARLADALKIDPLALLAQIEATTEKNETRRAYWQSVAKRVGSVTITIFVCALSVLVTHTEDAHAQEKTLKNQIVTVFRS